MDEVDRLRSDVEVDNQSLSIHLDRQMTAAVPVLLATSVASTHRVSVCPTMMGDEVSTARCG
jgi:hypothetical protein